MSFSKEVKEELSKLANLANKQEVKMEFLGYMASSNISEENNHIKFQKEIKFNIQMDMKNMKKKTFINLVKKK